MCGFGAVGFAFKFLEDLRHIPELYYEAKGLNGFKFHSDD